jgi:hypothetical protein
LDHSQITSGQAKMPFSLSGAAMMMIQRFTAPESHGGKDL